MYHNYSDKRVILSTREPAKNEFIFDDRVVFQGENLRGISSILNQSQTYGLNGLIKNIDYIYNIFH